ncbi:MAG: glycosyltransferase family 2 protein [Pseudomonadota bacterium]
MTLSAIKVSAVVCTLNAEKNIEECLGSLRRNGVGEIILVDADSKDKTREISSKYADKILRDPRKGLAMARNIGIAEASREYILNFGSDNVMPEGTLEKMLRWLKEKEYSGVSAMTYLKNPGKNYLSSAMNLYKKARYFPGERDVIGTPTLFRTQLLRDFPYDNKMGWSDDGDLCDRLRYQGHRFVICDAIVWEIGSEDIESVFYRWKGYGRSDWEIYVKHSKGWPFLRRVKSFSHPLRNELIHPFLRTPGLRRFAVLPFLLLITYMRYFSWIKHAIFGLEEKK